MDAFFGIGGSAQVGGGAGGGPSARCGMLLRFNRACALASTLRWLFEDVGTGGSGMVGGGAGGSSWIIGLGAARSETNGTMLTLFVTRGGEESALPRSYMSMEE